MNETDKELLVLGVHEIVRLVPYGRATSYGAIARALGYPNLSRKVGRIIGRCDSTASGIPAHRVVDSQGVLSGRSAFGSADKMQKLLESEGIMVANDRIKNWKTVFWDPQQEL